MYEKDTQIIIVFTHFFSLEILAQTATEEHWKELNGRSETIIVGVVEDSYQVIRPEKYKPNPGSSYRDPREFIVGELFRIKMGKKLKGKVKESKDGKDEYVYIFILGGGLGVPGIGDPVLFPKREYVFFLNPDNNEKELAGTEVIEYKPNNELIRRIFNYKSSYNIIRFGGAVEIKTDKNKLIKEIKKAI